LIFQPPTPASYISVWSKTSLIFNDSSQRFCDSCEIISNWTNADYVKYTKPLVDNYVNKVPQNFTDIIAKNQSVPLCWVDTSPLNGTSLHENFKEANRLYVVVCYWKDAMKDGLTRRIDKFMNWQVWFFFLSTLAFNLAFFVVFIYFFEKKLNNSIVKPIMDLTSQIKDPNKMKEAQQIRGIRLSTRSERTFSLPGINRPSDASLNRSTTIDRATGIFDIENNEEEDTQQETGPVDEVEALKNVFYSFFSDQRDQARNDKDYVLVKLEEHQAYFNPFINSNPLAPSDAQLLTVPNAHLNALNSDGLGAIREEDESENLNEESRETEANYQVLDATDEKLLGKNEQFPWLNQVALRLRPDWVSDDRQ